MKFISIPKIWPFGKVSHLGPVLLTLLAFPAYAQEAGQVTAKATTDRQVPSDVLIRQILESVDKGDLQQTDTLTRELGKGGDETVAAIQDSLRRQAKVRTMLIYALGQIYSDASTEALLQSADLERGGDRQILAHLSGRSINRRLSEKELQNWISWIQSDDGWQAGMAARLLSTCSLNDVEARAKLIVTRFVKELAVQKPAAVQHDDEAAERVTLLGEFLLAFSNFNDPKVVALLQQQEKEQTDPSTISWLTIALGFAGDNSVAAKLKNIVTQEKDVSTKAVALRTYCRVAKFAALPLLRSIMIEQIKTEGPNSRSVLMGTARSELFRLRSLPGFPTTLPAETP